MSSVPEFDLAQQARHYRLAHSEITVRMIASELSATHPERSEALYRVCADLRALLDGAPAGGSHINGNGHTKAHNGWPMVATHEFDGVRFGMPADHFRPAPDDLDAGLDQIDWGVPSVTGPVENRWSDMLERRDYERRFRANTIVRLAPDRPLRDPEA